MTVRLPATPSLIAALVLTVSLTGCDRLQQVKNLFSNTSDTAHAPKVIPGEDGRVAMLLPDFTQLVEREGPAVVNISANRAAEAEGEGGEDPVLELFKRLMPPGALPNLPNLPHSPQARESVSYGSGFLVSPDGYILTNAHVVAGASQIQIKLTDKREFKARLIGADKRTDVAVLKIEASDLPTVKIGSPAQLKVGEWVAAIGAPFGFDNTVTAGIVSAKGRSLPDENYVPFIQTDVAINPGNSGGPLFSLRGEVVGINSQIYSRSGGFMGISFAIPIDIAMNVAEQLKSTGKVSRGQLGVHIQELSLDLAKSFGRSDAKGALVVNVEANSAAAKAGIEVGDIILQFDGKGIESSKDLPILVGARPPGSQVNVDLWRKGEGKTVVVQLAELANETKPQGNKAPAQAVPPARFEALGLALREIPTPPGGLLIENAQGLAAKAGLMRGDVILAVNQTPVPTLKAFETLMAGAGEGVALLVRRGQNTLFIPMRLVE